MGLFVAALVVAVGSLGDQRQGEVRPLSNADAQTTSRAFQPEWLSVGHPADPVGPRIPFFIYSGDGFGITDGTVKLYVGGNTMGHAGADLAVELLLEQHPWRVTDATQALLFFVPLHTSEGLEFDPAVVETLLASAAYRGGNGTNHFTVQHHWQQDQFKRSKSYGKVNIGTVFSFEAVAPPLNNWLGVSTIRSTDSAPYYTAGCDSMQDGTQQETWDAWAARSTSLHLVAACPDQRKPMALRALALYALRDIPGASMVRVGYGASRLPFDIVMNQTRNSRFGIFTRGDTPSSQRLYDLLAAGTIPIIISDSLGRVGLPFACDVDWQSMAFFISADDFLSSPIEMVTNVLKVPEDELRRMLAAIHKFRKEVLFCADGNNVATNIIRQAWRAFAAKEQQVAGPTAQCRFSTWQQHKKCAAGTWPCQTIPHPAHPGCNAAHQEHPFCIPLTGVHCNESCAMVDRNVPWAADTGMMEMSCIGAIAK